MALASILGDQNINKFVKIWDGRKIDKYFTQMGEMVTQKMIAWVQEIHLDLWLILADRWVDAPIKFDSALNWKIIKFHLILIKCFLNDPLKWFNWLFFGLTLVEFDRNRSTAYATTYIEYRKKFILCIVYLLNTLEVYFCIDPFKNELREETE